MICYHFIVIFSFMICHHLRMNFIPFQNRRHHRPSCTLLNQFHKVWNLKQPSFLKIFELFWNFSNIFNENPIFISIFYSLHQDLYFEWIPKTFDWKVALIVDSSSKPFDIHKFRSYLGNKAHDQLVS